MKKTDDPSATPRRTSRRDMLLKAGAAAAGSVGALALGQAEAEAATGNNFVLGHLNDANLPTVLQPTTSSSPDPLMSVDGTSLLASQTALNVAGPPGGKGLNATGASTVSQVGVAVQAVASGSATGVLGATSSGLGVFGSADSGTGVLAQSNTGWALAVSGNNPLTYRQPLPQAGPPTTGTHYRGEMVVDLGGVEWHCTGSGTPGQWAPVLIGGGNNLLQAVITSQPKLTASDGATWTWLGLSINVTPAFACSARATGNADLWTDTAGYNQDIAIFVSGGAFGASPGTLLSWKESGGFAGTFSPNAAYVEAMQTGFAAGTSYTFGLYWKTNRPMPNGSIYCGAGPINGQFSPTRLVLQLIPS